MRSENYTFNISPELYITIPQYTGLHAHKLQGHLLRLVSGIDGNTEPGYHYRPDWTTVTIENAPVELHGIEKRFIQRIS